MLPIISRLLANLVTFPGHLKGFNPRAKGTPQKHCFFWSNPYKIEVMLTSLTEMLQLPHFCHMTTSTI